MGRTIITKSIVPPGVHNIPGGSAIPDNYVSQIVKLIPADIVAVYLGMQGVFAGVTDENYRFSIQLGIFIIILIIAPFFLKKVAAISDKRQIIIAVVSYIIWAISLGGPFEYLIRNLNIEGITAQQIGGALVMVYTLLVPMLHNSNSTTPTQPIPAGN